MNAVTKSGEPVANITRPQLVNYLTVAFVFGVIVGAITLSCGFFLGYH